MLLMFGCSDRYDLPDERREQEVVFAASARSQVESSHEKYPAVKSDGYVMLPADDDNSITATLVDISPIENDMVHDSKTIWGSTNTVTWVAGDQIGIYMRYSTGSFTTSNNVQYNISSVAAKPSPSPLTPNTNKIVFPYPMATSSMKFYAYYPYAGVNSATSPFQFANTSAMDTLLLNYSLPTDQSLQTTLSKCAIMTATPVTTTGSSPNVVLAFSHKMALITIKVTGVLGLAGNLVKATLSGTAVTGSGTLNLASSALTPAATAFSPFVTTNQTVALLSTASVDLIINPCTLTNNNGSQMKGSLQFTGLLNNNRTINFEVGTSSFTFSPGTRYTFNATVVL